ncbi:SAM-dependent methyltransferase [Sphingomonas kaistensis]|uniref:SAM-dependent methyltransferase n=1 Tax=Sphingomonas kaistensis TaxID=298708 RepID=A0A7X6BI20_9SPHN|nr:class I SAM-dependent methyltransferase [Sphingomonas kaistensis]NJC06696.1 SAM-dependent methyltransferase [Sphingomonas kaistensis]
MASKYLDLSADRIKVLRSADPAIKVIAGQSTPISFTWMRGAFKRDHDIKESLDWGKAILSDVDQLDQYLYTYGKMVCSQWQEFTANLTFKPEPLRVVDYGCGQGLAGILLSDKFGSEFRKSVKEVLLVEPSPEALIRAEAVYQNLFSKAEITCLSKKLGDLEKSDFEASDSKTLHLFSNILDITGFELGALFSALLTEGEHIVLAVSHNREFAGGAGRLRGIKDELDKAKYRSWIDVKESDIREFTCGDGGKFPAIGWNAFLGINRG